MGTQNGTLKTNIPVLIVMFSHASDMLNTGIWLSQQQQYSQRLETFKVQEGRYLRLWVEVPLLQSQATLVLDQNVPLQLLCGGSRCLLWNDYWRLSAVQFWNDVFWDEPQCEVTLTWKYGLLIPEAALLSSSSRCKENTRPPSRWAKCPSVTQRAVSLWSSQATWEVESRKSQDTRCTNKVV